MQKWSRLLYQPALPLKGDRRVTGCEEHIQLSRKAAEEGMVLLENDGTLPLSKKRPVALFGKGSVDYVKGGGGSGDVYCKYVHSLYDGLTAKGVSVYEPLIRRKDSELIAIDFSVDGLYHVANTLPRHHVLEFDGESECLLDLEH